MAGRGVKYHYLNLYCQVFLNIPRTQLGRRGVDSGVEGCLHLAQSVDLKQLLPMADAQLAAAEDGYLHGRVGLVGRTDSQLGFSNSEPCQTCSMPSLCPCLGPAPATPVRQSQADVLECSGRDTACGCSAGIS